MARLRKISAGVVNITLHPHTRERYLEFFKAAFRLKKVVKVYGDRHAILSSLDRSREAEGVLDGVITTFTSIDWNSGWFDDRGLQEATDEQLAQIEIPENLHPNAASFFFLFDANVHKLYVQLYSDGRGMTSNFVYRFISAVLTDLKLLKDFGMPNITIVQSKHGLKEILAIDVVKVVKMVVNKPNPDIFTDDFDEDVEKHLEQANSKKLTIEYEADAGKSILLPPDAMRVGESALDNGYVEVRGRTENGAVKLSTADYPRVLQDQYDPETTLEAQAFQKLIRDGQED